MNPTNEAPMTWIDVARTFAALPRDGTSAKWLNRANVSWTSLLLELSVDTPENEIVKWLESIFPSRVHTSPLRIELEGPSHATELPVELEVTGSQSGIKQSFGIIDGVVDYRSPPEQKATGRSVPVVAALSVKGGTGRTTSAVACALRWAASSKNPVLLVDADLEAPGITYLFKNQIGTPKISLEDVIALAHLEEDDSCPHTVSFAAERLRDHKIEGNLFILPLRRDIDELASSTVRPEHLSTPDRPFALADLLAKIAERLGCAGVVVDVRAGLVPLGVNLAMDPNVSPMVVTTLSDQSIRATAGLIRFLSREIRRTGVALRRPLLVVNRVPAVFKQTGMDKKLMEPLSDDLLTSLVPPRIEPVSGQQSIFDVLIELEPYLQVEVPELPDLQVATANWTEFTQQLADSGFDRIIGNELDRWISLELFTIRDQIPLSKLSDFSVEVSEARTKLSNYAEQLIAAENAEGKVPKPLVTQPLAALARRFQSEVPIAVSEGAKGTGKTLAARYLISQQNWSTAVSQLIDAPGAISAHIVPVCVSIQSSPRFQYEADEARKAIAAALGFGTPISIYESIEWLKHQLTIDQTEREWLNHWLDMIAWSIGIKAREVGAGQLIFEIFREHGCNVVAVIEGLEELYTSVNQPGVDAAMGAALVSLQQRLRSEARRPLGTLIFVRRDTVEAAIKQNLDQYRRENAAYALSWTEDEVLELAAWLATQSDAIPGLWDPSFSKKSTQDKSQKLDALWGRKLGPDDSAGKRTREAYTATWIIAVLSDLRGRIAPRDLVRLLASASNIHPDAEETRIYAERLIVPRGLKNAVEPTSVKKVAEAEEEISELRPIFAKFRERKEEVVAPLSQEALALVGITKEDLDVLNRQGIVLGDSPPLEVSELYRRGLGLRHNGARLSVVNLYRRARQR